MNGAKVEYFTGTVVEIVDKLTYEIKVDIPGLGKGYTAFPIRGELDEPQKDDFVILRCLDPVYKSYFLWEKLKENDFIGIRSNGKMISITPDEIEIGTFNPDANHCDTEGKGEPKPELENFIKIDKDGNITIKMSKNGDINISGDSNINVSGNTKINTGENCDIIASGDCTIKSPNVTITGGGTCTIKGTVSPAPSGAFCGIPNCLFTGTPHAGEVVSGT